MLEKLVKKLQIFLGFSKGSGLITFEKKCPFVIVKKKKNTIWQIKTSSHSLS